MGGVVRFLKLRVLCIDFIEFAAKPLWMV